MNALFIDTHAEGGRPGNWQSGSTPTPTVDTSIPLPEPMSEAEVERLLESRRSLGDMGGGVSR
jgi:hypothetical protein